MIHKILQKLDHQYKFDTADAHCDIPCGIYDPHHAQIGALTVLRMIDMIEEHVKEHGKGSTGEFINGMVRLVAVKEEHAELVKHEVRIIWGDFIKQNHLDEYPQLHGLVHKIMQLGSKARQTVNRETAADLLEAVNEFSEIFWKIKGKETKRVKAPFPVSDEIVIPQL